MDSAWSNYPGAIPWWCLATAMALGPLLLSNHDDILEVVPIGTLG